jgi:alpha-amylase
MPSIPLTRFQLGRDFPGALTQMSLGPDNYSGNALMVKLSNFGTCSLTQIPKIQFFTWDSAHPDMSWWKHFESEVPQLAELGVTQVWLPPPNKGTNNVCAPSFVF